jgi:hypothetical protein
MAVRVPREPEILHEATAVLVRHLSPSKVVRVLSAWQVGSGDYQATRDRLFAGETVDSLAEKVQQFESANANSADE